MDTSLHKYLASLLTDERRALFERLVHHRTRYLTVGIENIFQPHNASAVLRSCDCFGIQDVHVIENSNEYDVNPQVALGASKWLNLHRYNEAEENTEACYEALRAKGYRIVATTPHTNDCTLGELPLDQPTALIFGTELTGLTQLAMDQADAFVKIPMYGFTESFNISVSAAIVLHQLSEKMRASKIDWSLSEEEKSELLLQWTRRSLKNGEALEAEYHARQKR